MEPQKTQITQESSFSFSEKLQIFKNKYISKKTVGVVIALLIAVNIPVALYLNQQRQNAKQHASTNGAVSILDATTNQQITETTTPDIKLQILLPDNWDPPTPSVSPTPISKFNIIQQTYAQTTTPTDIPLTPTVTPLASPTPPTSTTNPSPTLTPPISITSSPTSTEPSITPTGLLAPTISRIVPYGSDGSLIIYFGSYTTATSHKMYRCSGADCDPTTQTTPIGIVPNATNYYIDPGSSLICNTNYSYTIKAVYPNGESTFSNTMPTVTTTCPAGGTITPSNGISPSPTSTPKHTLQSIIITNAENGDGSVSKTITGQELIAALTSPIQWKLNPLLPTETTALRKVNIQFIDSNNQSVTTFSEITLQSPNPPTSPTPPRTIDILEYFISKHQDKGLTGTHPLSQFVDGQRAYYMKWQRAGDPTSKSSIFEVYTWDNDNIYLKEDHSGAPVNFYTFAPGTWMKRHMTIGEKVTVSSNTIQWYDPTCNAVAPNNQSFPIEVTLERHDLAFPAGEDLGNQDVIVVKYDSAPGNTSGIFERFYYSKEWGWIKWEEYNKATNAVTNTSTFNKISQTPPLQPQLSAACTPEFRTANISPTPTPNPLGATLRFSPPSSSASASTIIKQIGDDITLDILLDPNGEIIVVGTLVIKYDPTSLEAKTFTTATGGNGTIGNGTASLPTIGLSETSTSMGIRTNGTKIATITFKAIKETPLTQVNFDMSQSNLTSAINQAVNVLKQTPNPAYITIGTLTTSPTPTSAISPIPTMTLMPTPTIPAGNTGFTIKVGLQGIGNGGNKTPVHQQRAFTIMLFDSNGIGVGSTAPNAILTFNPATNLFEGQADMEKPTPGNYTVKAKTDKFLTKVISNILPIVAGTTTYTFPTIPTLVAGDLNNDNLLNIADYNIYKDCLGKTTAECKTKVDLNNDGETDTVLPVPKFLDYRLLISNFSLQKGE